MSLDEHYLFSEPFPQRLGDTDQTVAAEEVASGVPVVIHLLAGGNSPANQEQLKAARDLPPASVRYLREIGEHRGTPYVVTEPLPGNVSFRSWLGQVTGRSIRAPEPTLKSLVASEPDASKFKKQVWKVPALPPTVDQAKPGEFTQMLRTGGAPETPTHQPPAPTAIEQPPSEFTQMLQAQGYPQPSQAPAAARPAVQAAPPPPPVPQKQGPGEFTQLLQAQGYPNKSQPNPEVITPQANRGFESMLQSASLGTGIRPAGSPTDSDPSLYLAQSPTLGPTAAAASAPSGYEETRLFATPARPAPEPLRSPPPLDFGTAQAPIPKPPHVDSPLTSVQPGEFTRMLQSPMAPTPQAPLFSPAEPVVDKTPGGFTQLFESPFGSPESTPRTPASAPAPSFPAPAFQPSQQQPPAQVFGAKLGAKDQNEFDRLFNEPKSPEAPAPASSAQPQGPSEYTLMFKSPAKPAAAAAPSAPASPAAKPAPAPAAKPPANYMMLIYVLGGLLVVAIAIVAYLLLKK